MTLIFTDSKDATVDILLKYLPEKSEIFRFNFDFFPFYKINVTPESFLIEDPKGRIVTNETLKKGYFRKPILAKNITGQEDYIQLENWTAYRSIVDSVFEDGKLVLVHPFVEKNRFNKLRQLKIAAKYFKTAKTAFTNRFHSTDWPEQVVVKSLNSGNLGNKTLFTTRVQLSELSPEYSWYVQEYIRASHDLTVVFVNGKCFGFSLDRKNIESGKIDCRSSLSLWELWRPYELNEMFQCTLREFMGEIGLLFGRFDFLIDEDGQIFFCEVNSNGQFAWLDLENKTNLLSAICDVIDPGTKLTAVVKY